MNGTPTLKIDGYAHISPPRYTEALRNEFPGFYRQILGITPPLFDMEARFRVMDAFAPHRPGAYRGPGSAAGGLRRS